MKLTKKKLKTTVANLKTNTVDNFHNEKCKGLHDREQKRQNPLNNGEAPKKTSYNHKQTKLKKNQLKRASTFLAESKSNTQGSCQGKRLLKCIATSL